MANPTATLEAPQNFGARPKMLLGIAEIAKKALSDYAVVTDKIPELSAEAENAGTMPHVPMNWQGRYRPLDKNCPALLPSAAIDNKKEGSEYALSRVLSRAQEQGIGAEGAHATNSQHEHNEAMKILFGEEITQQHIAVFTSLKRLMGKWRARAAQRKNIIAVEHFASDDIQKRAIIKHKEQAIVNLPMPIVWTIKEEVLAVLLEVYKVYKKEFGNSHKLTIEAKRRIDKLQSDLSRT